MLRHTVNLTTRTKIWKTIVIHNSFIWDPHSEAHVSIPEKCKTFNDLEDSKQFVQEYHSKKQSHPWEYRRCFLYLAIWSQCNFPWKSKSWNLGPWRYWLLSQQYSHQEELIWNQPETKTESADKETSEKKEDKEAGDKPDDKTEDKTSNQNVTGHPRRI